MDSTKPVRSGEELALEALTAYLQANLPTFKEPLVVEQFPSGHSNLTYLVKDAQREWVLRCPPKGAKTIKKGHDMGREYRILSRLCDVYPKVPRPALFCEDESIIGTPFYVMERLNGIILRSEIPKEMNFTVEDFRTLSENFVQNLVTLHAVDIEATGLVDIGHPEGYVTRQVKGWTDRYGHAKTEDVPAIRRLIEWLPKNKPPEVAHASMIHNDYKYDNLILAPNNPTEIVAVLDWEMATVGDPLMDLGTTLAYWVDPGDPDPIQALPFSLTAQEGNMSRNELVSRYTELSGHDTSHILFYYVYGMFKIAVVCQQLYYRYQKGYTKDKRFAHINHIVNLLAGVACKAIDKGNLEA